MSPREDREKDARQPVSELTPPPVDRAATSAGDAGSAGAEGELAPGSIFAGRYRMVERIGRGGMGEVWEAEDLVLQTPVALKIIHAADEEGRERILKEVRLSRQITHPAVCRVFDVGESDASVFYSMELVQGEDLATLLKRVGRLPSEKVIDIGLRLCDGVGAAHAQGVLHRDLKPANVLIDADGLVRITDFGIAITRGERRYDIIVGTPGYMAPEQLAPGHQLSERTDVYALGVMLYELLVGKLPLPDPSSPSGAPVKPSRVTPDVDPRLERIIMRALALDPQRRPASTGALAEGLRRAAPIERPWQHPWLAAALAAALVLLAVIVPRVIHRGAALTDHDTIVLADFVNTTGEPVFNRALKVALTVALEQSPFLRVFSDERVRETLQLIERLPDEPITRQVARDIARREKLTALIAGSIGSFGSHYVLTLEAINAESGETMAREQVEVPEKEQVLRSLGAATSRLREKLGESWSSIQRFDAPLPRATTASLDALNAYALALDEGRVSLRREAIPHLRRAIEIDPEFAMAQALLSAVYANTGQTGAAPEFAKRAFGLRDRVSERERYFISWRYYVDGTQDWEQAAELAESWTKTYPREAFAFNSLALAMAVFGRHDKAESALREALKLDPRFLPPYANLIGSLTALNRFDAAKAALSDAAKRGIDTVGVRRAAYLMAFLDGDHAGMTRALEEARGSPSAVWTSTWEARATAFAGRFDAAHELYRRGVQAALRENLEELAAQWTLEDAELYAIARRCDDARRRAAAGLELSRDNYTLERASRTLALCPSGDETTVLMRELSNRFPIATLTTRVQLPMSAAAQALQRHEPERAIALLDPVKPFDRAPLAEFWPSYLRGEAYLELKNGPAAAAEFQSIVDHRGAAPTSPLFPLAHLGLARAATLNGDVAAARKRYEAFFALWKDADARLPQLTEARREYAALDGVRS
ncbi:MAG TPA: serine/threonine-protein kinase [Vicinamibacterales bacterium]|nr:serine/threonine-protein kinase [Vicinamibacterales bacterium]